MIVQSPDRAVSRTIGLYPAAVGRLDGRRRHRGPPAWFRGRLRCGDTATVRTSFWLAIAGIAVRPPTSWRNHELLQVEGGRDVNRPVGFTTQRLADNLCEWFGLTGFYIKTDTVNPPAASRAARRRWRAPATS